MGQDKKTVRLDYSNHYNKANKCFIAVENHVRDEEWAWSNSITLWDVYENGKYGDYLEEHTSILKPEFHTEDKVLLCELLDKKCKSVGDFNEFIRPYLND